MGRVWNVELAVCAAGTWRRPWVSKRCPVLLVQERRRNSKLRAVELGKKAGWSKLELTSRCACGFGFDRRVSKSIVLRVRVSSVMFGSGIVEL